MMVFATKDDTFRMMNSVFDSKEVPFPSWFAYLIFLIFVFEISVGSIVDPKPTSWLLWICELKPR